LFIAQRSRMLSPSSRARSYTIRIDILVSARRNASSLASPFRWRSRELTQIISHLAHRLGVGITQLRYGCEAFRWCLSFARYKPFVALATNSPISTALYRRDEYRYPVLVYKDMYLRPDSRGLDSPLLTPSVPHSHYRPCTRQGVPILVFASPSYRDRLAVYRRHSDVFSIVSQSYIRHSGGYIS